MLESVFVQVGLVFQDDTIIESETPVKGFKVAGQSLLLASAGNH